MILSSKCDAILLQKFQSREGRLERQKSVMSVSQDEPCLQWVVEGKEGTGTSLCFDPERSSAETV